MVGGGPQHLHLHSGVPFADVDTTVSDLVLVDCDALGASCGVELFEEGEATCLIPIVDQHPSRHHI